MTTTDPKEIAGYHAHVYFDDAASRAAAAELREAIARRFDVKLGHWHDALVGPHLKPMYQVAFACEQFPSFIPWLALNHRGLSVLIHPETGDDPTDHSEYALWLGEKLPVNMEFLRTYKRT